MKCYRFVLPTLALGLLGLAACNETAVNKDANSRLLDSDDMQTMTNQMAEKIVADGRIQQAWTRGPLKIVIMPVTNLTNEIMPDGEAELYVARLRSLLARQPALADRFIWCINRADYDKLRSQEGIPEAKLGAPEERIVPEYALYAQFYAATNITRASRSDDYLCVYKLTKISNGAEGAELWSGSYPTSKHVKTGFLD